MEVIQMYKKGEFQVTHIFCDDELQPLEKYFIKQEMNVQVNFSSPNEHVPKIECSICVIKERIRATYYCLPYKQLSRIMLKILVSEAARKLNYFPSKNGVSQYYSQ